MFDFRSLKIVVLALHLGMREIASTLRWIGLDPASVPRRKVDWKHVRRSNESIALVFGPAGLRRVRGGDIVRELMQSDLRYGGCEVIYKPTKFTQRYPLPWDLDWDLRLKGVPKTEYGIHEFKECIGLRFLRNPPPVAPAIPDLLTGFLQELVWKRGRVTIVKQDGVAHGAIVDLSRLASRRSARQGVDLSFHPIRGFEAKPVILP